MFFLANVHVHHERDDVVTLVTLKQDNLLAGFALHDGAVAPEVLSHVFEDFVEVELRVEALDQRRTLSACSLLNTDGNAGAVALIGLSQVRGRKQQQRYKRRKI